MAESSFNDILQLSVIKADQTVAYGDKPQQHGEYWQAATERPLVVLIHGGCWLNAYDKSHIRGLASALHEKDLAVWSIEYRRLGDPGGGWPGTFNDVISGVNASEQFGHKNIVVVGHSAGGHLATWLGANSALPDQAPHKDKLNLPLKAVIGLAAVTDIETYATGSSGCERAAKQLLAGTLEAKANTGKHPEAEQLSPQTLDIVTPVILIHGESDAIVPIEQSLHFVESHPEARFVPIRAAGHFDLINNQGAAFDALVDGILGVTNDL